MEDIYKVSSYSDDELFAILDLTNPTDRELEAKILHMIWKYENFGNESGDRLVRFFKGIFDHFFDESESDIVEGFEVSPPAKQPPPATQPPATQPPATQPVDKSQPNYSVAMSYSKDQLNPLLTQTTKRIISIDSQYRDKASISTDYTFNLSDPLKDVINLKLYSVQIPYTWYTINNSFGSNFLYLKGNSPGITGEGFDIKVDIGVGNYTAPDLVTAVNNSFIKLKTNNLYTDISFGTTSITYDYPSSKATFNFDIKKTYNESNFQVSFPYWTTPNNDASGNAQRGTSIPAFLGFNESSYRPYVIKSQIDLLSLTTDPIYNTEIGLSQYTLTNTNKTFNIIQYTAASVATEYITSPNLCSILRTIPITLGLNVNTTYSRLELFNELNKQLDNIYLSADSSITRVDVSNNLNIVGNGYSHYELNIILSRITTSNISGAKVAVTFPIDASANILNDIWVGATSAFAFEKYSYELSNIISETQTSQSTIQITSNPYVLFKCTTPYLNGRDANGIIIGNTILNDYQVDISNSIGVGYTLTEYIAELNNKIIAKNTTFDGVFRLENTKAEIDLDSKINFKVDINKTFTQSSYDLDLSGTYLRSQFNFDSSYNTLTVPIIKNSADTVGGSGVVLQANTVIMIIKPKTNTDNRFIPVYTVISGTTQITSGSLSSLSATLNSIFQNFRDPDTNYPVLQGTTITLSSNGTTIVATLNIVVRKYVTQKDYVVEFSDPYANVNTTRLLAVDASGGNIKYSINSGSTWISSTPGIFSVAGHGISKNRSRWIAVGEGTGNTIAHSANNGSSWTGLGTSTFNQSGRGVAYNGTLWVAVGAGSGNTIAYSADNGNVWIGLGKTIFSSSGYGVTWNGTRFVALGGGGNTIAYSTNGITWTGLGTTIFSASGRFATWSGSRWVAVGQGSTHTIAHSTDGITWTGIGTTIFNTRGNSVTWNGYRFVAVGEGTNTIAYSPNGITWIGLGTTIFSTRGLGVSRMANTHFFACGQGTNTTATSVDGSTWIGKGTTLSFNTVSWDICDISNSWATNMKLGQTEYTLIDPAYNTNQAVTFSKIVGAEKIASDTITLTNTNNMNRIVVTPMTSGITSTNNDNGITIILENREYTRDQLITAINTAFSTAVTPTNSQAIASGSKMSVVSSAGEFIKLRLNMNKTYTSSDYKLVFYDPFSFVQCFTGASSVRNATWDSTLGWILGFRTNTEYQLSDSSTITGDNVVSINIYNYFMIVLDDYNHNHMNDGIVTTTQRDTDIDVPSYANRSTYKCDPITGNLIASSISVNGSSNLTQKQTYAIQENINQKRTAIASKKYSPGLFTKNVFALIPLRISSLTNNDTYVEQGTALQDQERRYFGPVNLQRMTVKLVNDKGETVDLNGANWSFSFMCEQLYQSPDK